MLGITWARMTQVMDLLLIPFPLQEAVLLGRPRLSERRAHAMRLGVNRAGIDAGADHAPDA